MDSTYFDRFHSKSIYNFVKDRVFVQPIVEESLGTLGGDGDTVDTVEAIM